MVDISIKNSSITQTIPEGTKLKLETIPDVSYKFVQWQDGCTNNPRIYVIEKSEQPIIISPSIREKYKYQIDVLVNNSSFGWAKSSGENPYLEDSSFNISTGSNNDEDFEFLGWNDGNLDKERIINVSIDSSYIANYKDLYTAFKPVKHYSDLTIDGAQYVMTYINDASNKKYIATYLNTRENADNTYIVASTDFEYDGNTITNRKNGSIFTLERSDVAINSNVVRYTKGNNILGIDTSIEQLGFLDSSNKFDAEWTIWNQSTANPSSTKGKDIFGMLGHKEFDNTISVDVSQDIDYVVAYYDNAPKTIMDASNKVISHIVTKYASNASINLENNNIIGTGFTNYMRFHKIEGTNNYYIYRKGLDLYGEDATKNYYLGCNIIPVEGDPIYSLISNDASLVDNASILIVNSGGWGMGSQASNNRNAVQVTIIGSECTKNDAYEFQLIKNGNYWNIYDYETNGYLYCASDTKNNYLRTSTLENSSTYLWNIAISNNNAIITAQAPASRNVIQKNSGGSIFSCYSGNQLPVQLYLKTSMINDTPSFSETSDESALDDSYKWTINYDENNFVKIANCSTGYSIIYDTVGEEYDCSICDTPNVKLFKYNQTVINDDSQDDSLDNIWWICNTKRYANTTNIIKYLTFNPVAASPRFNVYGLSALNQSGMKPVQLFYRTKK